MQLNFSVGKHFKIHLSSVIVTFLFAVAIILRFIQFPHNPPGFNQDELSSLYESSSLLTNGTDRWGNTWPVYFLSWGSGQSVLLSYIQIPFILLFGLNILSTRLLSLLVGLFLGYFVYATASQICNKKVGLLALLFTLFLPWHFMMYRWSLDANLLPPTFLMGIYILHFSIKKNVSPKIIIVALTPFALSLYAYGLSIFVVPFIGSKTKCNTCW